MSMDSIRYSGASYHEMRPTMQSQPAPKPAWPDPVIPVVLARAYCVLCGDRADLVLQVAARPPRCARCGSCTVLERSVSLSDRLPPCTNPEALLRREAILRGQRRAASGVSANADISGSAMAENDHGQVAPTLEDVSPNGDNGLPDGSGILDHKQLRQRYLGIGLHLGFSVQVAERVADRAVRLVADEDTPAIPAECMQEVEL